MVSFAEELLVSMVLMFVPVQAVSCSSVKSAVGVGNTWKLFAIES